VKNWFQTLAFEWVNACRYPEEPGSPLRHFTRILHRTKDDELMREVPTVRLYKLNTVNT
jgi:hypothetical protein